jgi:hypothetical protein
MNSKSMLKPGIIGGILLGVLSALPVANCGCCIWMIGGGVLAAYLYVKESPAMVTLGQGVLLGLLAGIIGTIVLALFQIPLLILSSEGSNAIVQQVQSIMDQLPGITAESREEFMQLTSKEGFVAFMYVSSLIVQLLSSCILAMLGGALGVAIFEKRKNREPVQGPPADEPPSSLPPPPSNPSN